MWRELKRIWRRHVEGVRLARALNDIEAAANELQRQGYVSASTYLRHTVKAVAESEINILRTERK